MSDRRIEMTTFSYYLPIFLLLCSCFFFILVMSMVLQNAIGDGDEDDNNRFDGTNEVGHCNIVMKYT